MQQAAASVGPVSLSLFSWYFLIVISALRIVEIGLNVAVQETVIEPPSPGFRLTPLSAPRALEYVVVG